MYLSNYAEIGILNTMRNITFAAPSNLYCGLFLSSPTETGVGGVEIEYPGYERQIITFDPPETMSGGIGIKNTSQINYAQSPNDAGTVRFIGIFDALTGGNMLLFGTLTDNLTILVGENPVLLAGEVVYFANGDLSNSFKTRMFNIFRKVSLAGFTPHLSLWNGNASSGGAELNGPDYARQPLTFRAPDTTPANGSTVTSNTNAITFNRPTTVWGTWTYTAVMDSASSGSPVWGQDRTPKILSKGIMPWADVGSINLSIN